MTERPVRGPGAGPRAVPVGSSPHGSGGGGDMLVRDGRAARPGRRVERRAWAAAAAVAYLAAATALMHGALGGLGSRAPLAGSGDVGQLTWFLRWTPYALGRGLDPLVSHAMNAPQGVNLMWNTAMPLAGLVMAPVTEWWGPLVSVNLLFLLGPASTAMTARWWLSRHVDSEAARLVGGAAVGFGPFLATHLGGHLNFAVLTLVPVLLALTEDVAWRCPGRRRPAVLLGVTAAGQALLSEEVLLLVAAGVAAAGVAGLLVRFRETASIVRGAGRGLALAAAVALLLLAAPLAVQLAGPDRARGVNTARYFAQPRDFLIPSTRLLLGSPAQDAVLQARGTSRFEDAVYLGLPVLVLLAATALVWWRRPAVRIALIALAILAVLALGSGRHGAVWTGWAHPAAPLLAPPVASSLLPQRFGLDLDLIVGWLLAQIIDAAVHAGGTRTVRARAGGALAALAVTAVAISWLPAPPAEQLAVPVPTFFTTAARDTIPAGAWVILLPAPGPAGDGALLDQAMAGMRFSMLGSYAISRDRTGTVDSHATPDPLTALATTTPPPNARQQAAARCAVARLGVADVLLIPALDPTRALAAATTALYGPPTLQAGGVQLWPTAPPRVNASCR